jgi:biopolymer transport protein ExbD
MKKVILVLIAISVVTLALATTDIKLMLPLAITSAGQSAEVETVNYVADEVGLKYDYCDSLSKDDFAAGVGLAAAKSGIGKHVTTLSPDPKGTKFQTLILVVGADLKGMGASGLSVDTEVARLKSLIEYAKANGIKIVAIAIGGEIRRGLPGSPNEVMIDTLLPSADVLVFTSDSNKDGRFSNEAKARNVPAIEIESAFDLLDTFTTIFGL